MHRNLLCITRQTCDLTAFFKSRDLFLCFAFSILTTFFQCFQYHNERLRYPYNWYNVRNTPDNFYTLMKSTEATIIRKIAVFVAAITKVKEFKI